MSAVRRKERAAILGSPVAHSLSPALHNSGYAALGLSDWEYVAVECDAEALPALVRGSGPEWAGYSVTMPGKAAAAAVADVRSRRVEMLGVANTLSRTPAGWSAENTDVDGILGALGAAGVGTPAGALLLGGGHTARSVVFALGEWGVREVVLAGRRPASTAGCAELCRRLGVSVREISLAADEVAEAAVGVGLVASTIPAGGADSLAAVLAGVPVLVDAVYHPWPTPLAAAGSADRITVTGLDMLLHQGLRQFEIFTGLPAPAQAMRDGLLRASGADLPLPV